MGEVTSYKRKTVNHLIITYSLYIVSGTCNGLFSYYNEHDESRANVASRRPNVQICIMNQALTSNNTNFSSIKVNIICNVLIYLYLCCNTGRQTNKHQSFIFGILTTCMSCMQKFKNIPMYLITIINVTKRTLFEHYYVIKIQLLN